jgi:hypothetical protein
MITYLYVSEAPWIARTGADGVATFRGVPAGSYSVQAWQPRLRPGPRASLQEKVALAEGAPTPARLPAGAAAGHAPAARPRTRALLRPPWASASASPPSWSPRW